MAAASPLRSLRGVLGTLLGIGMGVVVQLADATPSVAGGVATYAVRGDAIPEPLAGLVGDVARGRAIVKDRAIGNCLICHTAPEPDERFMGDLAPNLAGVGSRLTSGQLRLRLVDQSQINPATIMPPYHRVEGLTRVGARWKGQPALTAQQVEDVVAYLSSLKE